MAGLILGGQLLCSDLSEPVLHALTGPAREEALAKVFGQYREGLRRAISLRLDRRVAARVDASDILQETYLEAVRRLPGYLQKPSMPLNLWLRWLAREQVLTCHRRHLAAEKRNAGREVGLLPADSSAQFVGGIIGQEPSPSRHVAALELAERLRLALGRLTDDERDLILWRHFEQLTNRESALLLGISEAAAGKRYLRALERLRDLLLNLGVSGSP
jgi:RNA polymerase sigma-70 factor (ECF subfamily)